MIDDPLSGGQPYAILPEPGTMGLMMVGGYMLLLRRLGRP